MPGAFRAESEPISALLIPALRHRYAASLSIPRRFWLRNCCGMSSTSEKFVADDYSAACFPKALHKGDGGIQHV